MIIQTATIESIASVKGGKRLPKGHELLTTQTNHSYIRARDIRDGKIEIKEPVYITDSTFQKISRYTVKNNDLAITIVGVNIGDIGIVSKALDGANLTENASKISTNPDLCDPKFLLSQLSTPFNKFKFQQIAAGAAQGKLGLFKIKSFKVTLPKIDIQKKIADIHFTYTYLIENNRRRIELLEESARLLFREWFVYFKFPNNEKVKIVDGVPEGWENSTVNDCTSFISRGPTLDYISEGEDDGVPVLNQRCVRNGEIELDTIEYAKELSLRQKDLYLREFDIVVNSMGEGTLGRVSRNLSIKYPMIVHNCITVIRANENIIEQTILFYRLSAAQTYLETMGLGSTGQTSLKKEVIERIKILIPSKELREQFDSIVKPMWIEVGALKTQNQKLAYARDLLLPRLMSGSIEV